MKEEEQPREGHWGPWSELSDCSAHCGPGIRTKNRTCDNPVPTELSEEFLMANGTRGLAEEWITDCELDICPGGLGRTSNRYIYRQA